VPGHHDAQGSGFDVCRAIRREDERVPIIFISAKSEELDKVLASSSAPTTSS